MKILLRILSVICVCKISTVHSQETGSNVKGPGVSSCTYFAGTKSTCDFKDVTINELPPSCTSLFFTGLSMSLSYDLYQTFSVGDVDDLATICNSDKNVYVKLLPDGFYAWTIILACTASVESNAVDVSNSINAYTAKYPKLVGLVLGGFEPPEGHTMSVGFTENLSKFIEVLKRETKKEIALGFPSNYFIQLLLPENRDNWLKFPLLNECVNFYSFETLDYFNNCTSEFKNGNTPIDGDEYFTLDKLASAIKIAEIPKEKAYISILLGPRESDYDSSCDVNYQMMCTSPNTAKAWCADTQETFFHKGQWIKQNAAGFNGFYIDLDDPQNCCDCGPYPSFYAILAGQNGTASVPKCPLFDRC